MERIGLAPGQIIRRKIGTTLVDVVYEGNSPNTWRWQQRCYAEKKTDSENHLSDFFDAKQKL